MVLKEIRMNNKHSIKAGEITDILIGALPYMQRYADKAVVIKYGGHAMSNAQGIQDFARDVVLLKQAGIHPIVVHGGGPQIANMLERLGIVSKFTDGLRVTDQSTVEIVEMVLCGQINKSIVTAINQVGGLGVGISGKDGNLVIAEKLTRTKRDPDSNIERIIDLGFVGDPVDVNTDLLELLLGTDAIPVIAPIGVSRRGQTYNINADTFAGAIAGAIEAERFIMLTDTDGVRGADGELIRELSIKEARNLIKKQVATGGMIPKLETCIQSLNEGVSGVVILNGKVAHATLIELLTDEGAGTLIVDDD